MSKFDTNIIENSFNECQSTQTDNECVSLKNFKLNKIRHILDTNNKESQTNDTIKEEYYHLEKIKRTIVEWSLLTKFECLSKVFEYKNPLARLVWAAIFLIFSVLTVWLVTKCILDYLEYDIVTKTKNLNDRPTLFPAVTICNSNSFSSLADQDNFNNNNESNLTWSELSEKLLNTIEVLKMRAANPSFGDLNRRNILGFPLRSILSCRFNGYPCDYDNIEKIFTDFNWYYSFDYGNCWQFNVGLNYTKNGVDLKSTQIEG